MKCCNILALYFQLFFSNFVDELVLPFLWAQDGFSEPSDEMAEALKFGLSAPSLISFGAGEFLLGTGLVMLIVSSIWIVLNVA